MTGLLRRVFGSLGPRPEYRRKPVVILINGELAADSAISDLLRSNLVRVSLKSGTDGVGSALGKVGGGSKVTRKGADPDNAGLDLWICEISGDQAPVQAIVEAALANKWTIGAVSREVPSLESVFRNLMQERAADATKEKAA